MRLRSGIVCLLVMFMSLSHTITIGAACDFSNESTDSIPIEHTLEMGFIPGNSGNRPERDHGIALTFTSELFLSRNLTAGPGLGWMSLSGGSREQVFPLFLSAGMRWPEPKVKPVLRMDAGWGFPANDGEDRFIQVNSEGGLYLNPSASLQVPIGERNALQIGLGYLYQKMSHHYRYIDYGGETVENVSYNRWKIDLGIVF